MRLIGAGLPRTGTLSQKVALEMLGFGPCYHMVNVLGELDLADEVACTRWRATRTGTTSSASTSRPLTGRDRSTTASWLEVYPDAKVLLSVRDGDAWATSMRDTIWGLFYGDILIKHLSEARRKVDPEVGRLYEHDGGDVAPQRPDLRRRPSTSSG